MLFCIIIFLPAFLAISLASSMHIFLHILLDDCSSRCDHAFTEVGSHGHCPYLRYPPPHWAGLDLQNSVTRPLREYTSDHQMQHLISRKCLLDKFIHLCVVENSITRNKVTSIMHTIQVTERHVSHFQCYMPGSPAGPMPDTARAQIIKDQSRRLQMQRPLLRPHHRVLCIVGRFW